MTARRASTHSICDSLYDELQKTNSTLDHFISTIVRTDGKTRETLDPYLRHLEEIRKFIEWKMEIFSKVCPADWQKHNLDFESTASVKADDENDFPAGGFVGG